MKPFRLSPVHLFLGTEGALYLSFLALDLTGRPSTPLKYLSILLCLAAAAPLLRRGGRLFPAAMALTLFADTFLLLLNRCYLAGVLAFCCVQALYAARLFARTGPWSLLPRAALFALALAALGALDALDPLTAASAFSFSQLTVSAALAALTARRRSGGGLFAAGLALFWCCDACVGLHNLLSYLPGFPLPALVPLASFGMWLFYLPSQVLLLLSEWKYSESEGYG